MTAAKDVMIGEMPQGYAPIVQMVGRCYARMSKQFPPHEAYAHFPMVPTSYESKVFASNRLKRAYSRIVVDGAAEEDYADDLNGKSELAFEKAALEAAMETADNSQWENINLAV